MAKVRRPQLKTIDWAIKLIENGSDIFTCMALHQAAFLEKNCTNDSIYRYLRQYKVYVFRKNHGQPSWWNSNPWYDKVRFFRSKEARLRALRGFRQACIDAAKEQQ